MHHAMTLGKAEDYTLLMQLSTDLAKSGFFRDAQGASQAFAKVLAGAEMGLAPFAAMTAFHCIDGKLSPAANTFASFVRSHPYYDYRVTCHTREVCEIEFFRGAKDQASGKVKDPEKLGVLRVNMKDVPTHLTGKPNWKNFPRQMLFARAISEGARAFCPDVFRGATIYTREELEDARDLEQVRDISAQVFTPGSDAEMGQVEAQAETAGREVVVDEPDFKPIAKPAPAAPSSGPPPGAEADDLRDQIAHLMPRVPEARRAQVSAAVTAAGANVGRLREGLQFVKGLVAPEQDAGDEPPFKPVGQPIRAGAKGGAA